MRAFAYVAFTADGAKRTGSVVAETETAAADQLQAQGLYVSDLTAKATPRAWLPARALLSPDLQAVFTRQMAVLLGADMPVEAALEAVRQGGHRALETAAARARAQLMDGASLSESLATSNAGFPAYCIASIEAGERAGDLGGVFSELADFLERQGEDKAVIGTALIYPAFVAAVSLLVCGILMVNVAPEIVRMFALSDRPLPQITQVVLAASNWIQANMLALCIAAAALVTLAIASGIVPSLRAMRARIGLRLPLVGRFMRLGAAVQYLRTLALVLASRNTVPNAVDSAAGVLTVAAFQRGGADVRAALTRGESLGQALQHLPIIPPVAHQLIQAGEASARLAPMTDRAAQMVEHGLVTERKRIAAVLEPVLMMVVGAMVLVIVLAVLLPIFDLQAVVG
ncbi:type II secretion system F family protein [uncultured Tateyamaria sp.]|uniref:type II secretion system F family protein n=1 Tax=Tateyamaria sp. 1078 TaxID=3417464 RepID=UPI00261C8CB9|nr:type II secretion system F family protein [uncultured Tateyamaria sp.]